MKTKFGKEKPMSPRAIATDVEFTRSVATISWIHPDAKLFKDDPNGVVDFQENTKVKRRQIVVEHKYRFANFLEARIHVQGGIIRDYEFTTESGIYVDKSAGDIEAEVFAICRLKQGDAHEAHFRQLVGARTHSPETLAERTGSILCGPLAPLCGRLGREVAEQFIALPPIWTELSLSIKPDGSMTCAILRYSLFPMHCFYCLDLRDKEKMTYIRQPIRGKPYYYGTPYYKTWKELGWGAYDGRARGNPWSIPNPKGWGDHRTADHQACPRNYPVFPLGN